jgi:F-type H+-transporting ATPase subunit gamma
LATLRDIRRRITSVKSTQQITKAMKMVSAAKLRKAQERVLNARPYALRLNTLVCQIAAIETKVQHPLLQQREEQRVAILVVTADRGLCGSFNANVIKRARHEADQNMAQKDTQLITVGKKSLEFFRRRDYPIAQHYLGIFDTLDFQIAVEISRFVQAGFSKGDFDRFIVVYNSFKSVGTQLVNAEQLLPVEARQPEAGAGLPADYIYEPDAASLLDRIVLQNLDTQIWRVLIESSAAEQAARMIAMESATENAEDMIYDLTLHYNKARQAAITKEIAEIVGGAEALRG